MFGGLIIIVVICAALALCFTEFMNERLFATKRIFFIFMLFAYATYRIFRLRHLLNKFKNKDK